MDSADMLGGSTLVHVGLWTGFLLSLALLSLLVRDNGIARLAQHILVGAALGYAGILVWKSILQPRLFAPLLTNPSEDALLWAPMALGVLLWAAGAERLARSRGSSASPGGWRGVLRMLGAAPVTLMLGVTLGVAVTGAVQGTLLPQFMAGAALGFDPLASGIQVLTGVLTLLITTGALLHLFTDSEQMIAQQPGWVRSVLSGWLWIGKRGLWLAAGMVFARLMAARFSLLIANVDFLFLSLSETGLWKWAESIWQSLL